MTNRVNLKNLVTVVSPEDTIHHTVQEMAVSKALHKGFALVVDKDCHLLGVFNDGDLIRLMANQYDLKSSISNVMVKSPIRVSEGMGHEEIIRSVQSQLRERGGTDKDYIRNIIVVDSENRVVNVFNYFNLLATYKTFGEHVAIYGMGYVGLTLAAALASVGHVVNGIDTNKTLIEKLNEGQVHVHEPRLSDMVQSSLNRNVLSFHTEDVYQQTSVYIMAVGTPVDHEERIDLSAIEGVSKTIAKRLKRGDLVMLRSTVPIETTRTFVKPILEKESGLKAGQDFFLAFTPERTIEGKAMLELRELPQIVGGLTPVCTKKAATFWATLTDTVVQVKSLEGAEMVKLINNSYRDLTFSFSNSIALVADQFNIDAFKLIAAANEGYHRSAIPVPSPGVGGYCLTKDPLIFASTGQSLGHAQLARMGRYINNQAAGYPLKLFYQYVQDKGLSLDQMKVMIIGIAFKGWPETNDTRGSGAITIANELSAKGAEVLAWDAVLKEEEIVSLGFECVDFKKSIQSVDAIFILNNHPKNVPNGFLSSLMKRESFIFDGWAMLESRDVEQTPGLTYATMGYLTSRG